MPIRQRTRGRRIRVKPNALVGPFSEGTVLSQEYLEEVHNADIDHILRNGGAEEVSADTPLTPIAGADLAPLVAGPHHVVGGHGNPVLANEDGSPVEYEEAPTPHAPPPAHGRVPKGGQSERQRAEAGPNFQSLTPPKTDEELHANDQPLPEGQGGPAGVVRDTQPPADPNAQPAVQNVPGTGSPVDLDEGATDVNGADKPGTGTSAVTEDAEAEAAHRPANRGRGGRQGKADKD